MPDQTAAQDEAFLRSETDELAPFVRPTYEWVTPPGQWPYIKGDAALDRLFSFSCHPEPFNWVEDPRYPAWQTLVERLNDDPDPALLRELDPAELWQIMLTVVRKDRFSDGTFAACSPALTVMANAIREHLHDDRRAGRPFDRYGLRPPRPS